MTYASVTVDVDLSEFDTDDLIEELESRDVDAYDANSDVKMLVREMFERECLGKPIDEQLKKLYWNVIGRAI